MRKAHSTSSTIIYSRYPSQSFSCTSYQNRLNDTSTTNNCTKSPCLCFVFHFRSLSIASFEFTGNKTLICRNNNDEKGTLHVTKRFAARCCLARNCEPFLSNAATICIKRGRLNWRLLRNFASYEKENESYFQHCPRKPFRHRYIFDKVANEGKCKTTFWAFSFLFFLYCRR